MLFAKYSDAFFRDRILMHRFMSDIVNTVCKMVFHVGKTLSIILVIPLFHLSMFCGCCTASRQDDPAAIIRIPGDLDILAVLNYREETDGLQCTGPYNHRVAYDVEALRFAIEYANANRNQNSPLGLTVVDACANPVSAILDISAALSGTDNGLAATGPTVGILVPGSGDDVTKVIVEQISQRLGITTIGYLPAEEIDDVTGSVLTSAIPLTSETSVLTTILTYTKWYNVGLVYSGYGSGPSRRDAFVKLAGTTGVCVSYEQSIPYGLTQAMADNIVSNLASEDEDIQILVWIVTPDEIKLLLRSMRLTSEQFTNVGSSAWRNVVKENLLGDDLLREASGTIFIDDVTNDGNPEFEAYISQLNLNEAVQTNPWLNRTIIEGSPTINDTVIASHTSSLIRAVEMLSRGINITLAEICSGTAANDCVTNFIQAPPNKPIYDAVKTSSRNGEEITKTYRVLVMDSSNPVEAGTITTMTGRSRNDAELELIVRNEVYRSDDCLCFINGLQERTVDASADSLWAYDFSDPWVPAIFAVSLFFGIFACIMIVCLGWLCRYPVSRKSALWANFLLLIGIIMMYFINVIYIRVPTELSCGFRQFGTAFIHAWVFAALLVKCLAAFVTLDRKGKYDTTQSNILKSKLGASFQFSAFMALLAPQIALSVQWIISSSPGVKTDPDVCGPGATRCELSNHNIVLSMIYVFILVVLTFLLSLARMKDARLIQESRSLFLSSLSSIFLMVAWIIGFTIADPMYRIPAICVGVTANATVILLSCFGPLCCVIVFGEGRKTQDVEEEEAKDDFVEDEDQGDDIAYVNPAFLGNMDQAATRL